MWAPVLFSKRYLNHKDWAKVCVALRLPPPDRGSHCSLRSLLVDAVSRKSFARSEGAEAGSELLVEFTDGCVPSGGFVLNERHLHLSIPWREPQRPLVDGYEAAEMLQRIFIDKRSLVLDSITCNIRLPLPGLNVFVDALSNLIRSVALRVTDVCITCEIGSSMSQFVGLGLIQVGSQQTSTTPSAPPVRCKADQIHTSCGVLKLVGLKLPLLSRLTISVPFEWAAEAPKLKNVALRYLEPEVVDAWCRGGLVECAEEVWNGQRDSIESLIDSIACSVVEIQLTGGLELRRIRSLFSATRFLPALKSLNLGWTCAEELTALLESLQISHIPLSEMLRHGERTHQAIYDSLAVSMSSGSDECRLMRVSNSDSQTNFKLPPKLPCLKRLSFSGPMRVGLSDMHLELYAAVNKVGFVCQI